MDFKNIFFSLQEKGGDEPSQDEIVTAMVANAMKNDLDNLPSEVKPKGDYWTQFEGIGDKKNESNLTQEQRDELGFMRGILQTPTMQNLFKESPKKGNIQFNLEKNAEPFSYSYKDGEACIVKGVISKNDVNLDYHVPSELKGELTLNEQEKKWQQELTARHELNHCKFNDLKETLFLTKDKDVNKKINELAASNERNNLSKRVNEGFAETLAVMQMLQTEDSPEFRVFLQKHTIMRESSRLAYIDSTEKRVHADIPHALKILLQEDNIKDVKKMGDDTEAMEKKALQIANEGTRLALSKMTPEQRKDIYGSIVEGVGVSLQGVLTTVMKTYAKEQFGATKLANFSNLYDDVSSDNAMTRRAADIYIKEVAQSNPEKIKEMVDDMTELGEVKRGKEAVGKYSEEFLKTVTSNPDKYFGKGTIGVLDKLESEIVSMSAPAINMQNMPAGKVESLNFIETQKNIQEMKANQTGFLKISPDFAERLEKIQEDFSSVNRSISVKLK